MRDEKFEKDSGDDINYAFNYNGLVHELDNIETIVAEVCGEHDGADWYWILLMKDGTFAAASGGCDYTGWDCQSSAGIEKGFKTPEEAIASFGDGDSRKIKEVLKKQIDGELPFAVYQE